MTRGKFIIALFCAEWLVIFKAWLAPSVLFMLVSLAGLRLYVLSFIPHWMGAEAVIGVAGMALFIHLRYIVVTTFLPPRREGIVVWHLSSYPEPS